MTYVGVDLSSLHKMDQGSLFTPTHATPAPRRCSGSQTKVDVGLGFGRNSTGIIIDLLGFIVGISMKRLVIIGPRGPQAPLHDDQLYFSFR